MLEGLYSKADGYLMILGYAVLAYLVTFLFTKLSRTKENFLVADRKIGVRPAAFSIAATWIWAPALFVAAQQAYNNGWVGVFWFTVPNVLTLVAFAFFAERLRKRMPDGFTLSGYMRERFSKRVQNVYLFELFSLGSASFAVQLLAGGVVITTLTGIPFWQVTVLLAIVALGYSLFSGLGASIITDYLQMGIMAVGVLVFAPWAISQAGTSVLVDGLSGKNGDIGSLFSGAGGALFWSFGITVTIGLMAGPFGDQSFYQRAWAVKEGAVKRAFLWGAAIFAIVPVMMSMFGFLAAGMGLSIADTQITNLEAVRALLPLWVVVPFVFILLSGLVSTLDSNLASVSSLAGHDVLDRLPGGFTDRGGQHRNRRWTTVSFGRVAMVVLAVAAVGIANIPGMKILYLFLLYGILRATVFWPTVLTLWFGAQIEEAGVYYGIVLGLVAGFPLFAWGSWNKYTWAAVTGTLIAFLSSGVITYALSARKAKKLILTPEAA